MLSITRVCQTDRRRGWSFRYPLRAIDGERQFGGMSRDRAPEEQNTQLASEGPAKLWERIRDLQERKDVSSTQLAKAADVTWHTAQRWALPPERGGSVPEARQLPAIARELGVTIDELMRVYDGHEPPYESWQAFRETDTFRRLNERQRRLVAAHPWDDDEEPTLGSWLAIAEGHLSTRKKEPKEPRKTRRRRGAI